MWLQCDCKVQDELICPKGCCVPVRGQLLTGKSPILPYNPLPWGFPTPQGSSQTNKRADRQTGVMAPDSFHKPQTRFASGHISNKDLLACRYSRTVAPIWQLTMKIKSLWHCTSIVLYCLYFTVQNYDFNATLKSNIQILFLQWNFTRS